MNFYNALTHAHLRTGMTGVNFTTFTEINTLPQVLTVTLQTCKSALFVPSQRGYYTAMNVAASRSRFTSRLAHKASNIQAPVDFVRMRWP